MWSTITLHFSRKGAVRAQLDGHSPELVSAWQVLQLHTGVTLSWHPLPAPVLSPPKPKEFSFGAEQLCVHKLDKELPTSVCDRYRAQTLFPWYSAEPSLSWTEKFDNFLYFLLNDSPKLILKSWIVDIGNCISISPSESGPRRPKQEAILRNYVQNKSGHRWVEEKNNYITKSI